MALENLLSLATPEGSSRVFPHLALYLFTAASWITRMTRIRHRHGCGCVRKKDRLCARSWTPTCWADALKNGSWSSHFLGVDTIKNGSWSLGRRPLGRGERGRETDATQNPGTPQGPHGRNPLPESCADFWETKSMANNCPWIWTFVEESPQKVHSTFLLRCLLLICQGADFPSAGDASRLRPLQHGVADPKKRIGKQAHNHQEVWESPVT